MEAELVLMNRPFLYFNEKVKVFCFYSYSLPVRHRLNLKAVALCKTLTHVLQRLRTHTPPKVQTHQKHQKGSEQNVLTQMEYATEHLQL